MEPLAISSATQTYQSTETGSTLAASGAAEGQTFAELFAAQMKESTLAAAAGVDTEAPAEAAGAAVSALAAPSYAVPSGYAMQSALGGSDNLMTAMLLMMAGGSFGGSYGMNAAMTSMLSAIQNGGFAGLNFRLGNPASSATGQAIVQQAMSRLGDPYSKSKRGTGNYVDCSYLAQWAYKQVGINIPGTAAAQAKYCYENGYTISKEELQPGDLIFWTKHSSTAGRWRNIHHVGIYAGNGKIVEAKNNRNGVEIDDIWGQEGNGGDWEIVMYARPY